MNRIILAAALVLATLAANADEKVAPAFVPEQAQASALAVPDPVAPKPTAVLVIIKCGRVIGVIVSDSVGDLHPLDLEGVSQSALKQFIESAPKHISANVGCKADIEDQLSTL